MEGQLTWQADERRAGRRAWISAAVVWSLVFQLLLPFTGPIRHAEGAGMALHGRIVPICTLAGVRLLDLDRSDSESGNQSAMPDGGWHCALCALPGLPPAVQPAAFVPAEWRFAHAVPPATAPPGERPRSPLSARGPPTHS